MAYDEGLATRIRELIGDEPGLVEKKMFGGLAFLVNGNMACGVHSDELIVRSDRDTYETYVTEPGAKPFEMTGRPMRGWLLVEERGISEDEDLRRWVDRGVTYARGLLPK